MSQSEVGESGKFNGVASLKSKLVPASCRMKSRPSKNFKWSLETRLLLVQILAMVDKNQASKRWNASSAAGSELPLAHTQKWEEVACWLPPVFNAIDPSRRATTCYSQFNQLRQRLKHMRPDDRNRYRRASDGKRDPLMTNELCWKIIDYMDNYRLCRGPGLGHQVTVNNDIEPCTASNLVVALDYGHPQIDLEDGHWKHIETASNDKQLCHSVDPELHESRADVPLDHGGPRHEDRGGQKLCGKEVLAEMKALHKVPRSGMYRWSEDARLQVIQGVKMMESNLGQAGQIKNWREIAASLPKNLFWDVDLDRLASIAKKQFSEMRRRYRIMVELENSGAVPPVRFKTLTKRVLQEMATVEEGSLQRASRAPRRAVNRKLCNRKEAKLNPSWATITPSQALNAENDYPGAHGAVLVEIISWRSGVGTENDSFVGGVIAKHDPVHNYDALEGSIVPNDGSWSSGYDAQRESTADSQSAAADIGSEEYESSYSKLLESEDQDLSPNRERNEGSFSFDNRSRHMSKEFLRRQRGCSSAISISSSDSEPESSDCPKDHGAHLRNQEGSESRGHSLSSANSDSEESLEGRHPNSEGSNKGDLQRQIHNWQRGIRPLGSADERDSQYSDENPENGSGNSEYQSESLHDGNSDHVSDSYDSAPSDDESISYGDAGNSQPHLETLRKNNSELSGDFGQSDPGTEKFLNGERSESFRSQKASSPADGQWGETARRGHETSRSSHPQRDQVHEARPPIEQGKMKGEFLKHADATVPSGTEKIQTDSSGPDHHDQSFEGAPVLQKMLRGVDLEFSKLNWWVQHELVPLEREKIKNVIRSVDIPKSLKTLGVGSDDGGCDEMVSICKQNRLRLVLKAELEQVRLKLFEEIDKSSQVVIQEILRSLQM